MAKAVIFKKRDAQRFRKIYNYIRRKPVETFVANKSLTIIAGTVNFSNTSESKFKYKDSDPDIIFKTVPAVTAIAIDSLNNDSANVNIFVSQISRTEVTFESSAPFDGVVSFQVISQD